MIKFIKSLFQKPSPPPTPVPGEIYRLKNDDPFLVIKAEVVDVKDGWVQYRFCRDGYNTEDIRFTHPFSDFLSIYKKLY